MYFIFQVILFSYCVHCYSDVVLTGGLTEEKTLSAGQQIQGNIPLMNTGEEEALVKIELADYLHNAAGENFFNPPGTNPRSNSSWITFNSPFLISIPPKKTYDFQYSIQVPSDKNLSGTYWSLLLIEPTGSANVHGVVNTVVRYGVQIITHVGDEKPSEFKVAKCEFNENHLEVDAENSGTVVARPEIYVEIQDSAGLKIGPYKGPKERLLPGCSNRYRFDIASLEPGSYKARIVIDGENSTSTGTYRFEIRDP